MWEVETLYVGFQNEKQVLLLEKVKAAFTSFLKVKYKEDLSWLRGIGCYAWDTPDFALAEKNKVLYSGVSKTVWIFAKYYLILAYIVAKFFSGVSSWRRHWYESSVTELKIITSKISVLTIKKRQSNLLLILSVPYKDICSQVIFLVILSLALKLWTFESSVVFSMW